MVPLAYSAYFYKVSVLVYSLFIILLFLNSVYCFLFCNELSSPYRVDLFVTGLISSIFIILSSCLSGDEVYPTKFWLSLLSYLSFSVIMSVSTTPMLCSFTNHSYVCSGKTEAFQVYFSLSAGLFGFFCLLFFPSKKEGDDSSFRRFFNRNR